MALRYYKLGETPAYYITAWYKLLSGKWEFGKVHATETTVEGVTVELTTNGRHTNYDYFSHDPLDVRQVTKDELPRVADASHGVLMERVGASGLTANQRFTFDMRIDNPALTAQVLVSSARAAVRLAQSGRSGAYTLIDVPPVLLLPGERIDNIGRLV